MQGQRRDVHFLDMEPGDYGRWENNWICKSPNGLVGNLKRHEVTEQEDGTITVTPSILINGGAQGTFHGFLENGIWRSV